MMTRYEKVEGNQWTDSSLLCQGILLDQELLNRPKVVAARQKSIALSELNRVCPKLLKEHNYE